MEDPRETAAVTRNAGTVRTVDRSAWLAGAIGGFLGSLAMGALMPAATLEVAIPAMYGLDGPAPLEGWTLHQLHGVVLGLVYVALVQVEPVRAPARRLRGAVALGVAYGVATTLVLSVIVMPVWLATVGFEDGPPFPNLSLVGTTVSIVAHVVYALPVALAYALVSRR